MAPKDDDEVDANGIPLKSSYDRMPLPVPVLYGIMTVVSLIIGQAAAFGIYLTDSGYETKVAILAVHDLGWLYVGMIVLYRGFVVGVNGNLGVARKECKVNVPDQQVYSVYSKPGQPKLGYVLMEKEGVIGRFNRAQRALQNYLESAPFMLAFYLLSGLIFPFPTFCIACFYSAARIMSAIGYTSSADGRMAGNMLGMLSLAVLEGLVLHAGVRALLKDA